MLMTSLMTRVGIITSAEVGFCRSFYIFLQRVECVRSVPYTYVINKTERKRRGRGGGEREVGRLLFYSCGVVYFCSLCCALLYTAGVGSSHDRRHDYASSEAVPQLRRTSSQSSRFILSLSV